MSEHEWGPATGSLVRAMAAARGIEDLSILPPPEHFDETYEFAPRQNPVRCSDVHPGEGCGSLWVYRYKPGKALERDGWTDDRVFCLCGFTEYREEPDEEQR